MGGGRKLCEVFGAASLAFCGASRFEYDGEVKRKKPLTITFQRTHGPDTFKVGQQQLAAPSTFSLECSTKTIQVHPAFATLVAGWKNEDDTMEPAAWAPPRTYPERATVCTVSPESFLVLPATRALHFGAAKKVEQLETAGIEWAYNNSDMVVQEGGFRYVPSFSVR